MTKKKSPAASEARELRRQAEARVKRSPPQKVPEQGARDPARLVEELQVHQIELEIQNEELHGARLAIEAGLARYAELFDFAPLGYVVLGPDERIREINHMGAQLLGRERSELVGAHFEQLVAPAHRAAFNMLLGRARESEKRESVEVDLSPMGAGAETFALSAVTLAHAEPATLIAFEDITDRKAREDELHRTQEALQDADRRKDEFLAALSHELRNPLGPIRTSMFVLSNLGSGEAQARRARAIIDRQVTHLTRLVDDLLDVTRIARGKIQLRRQRLDLAELVRATIEDQRASFEAAGVRLEASLEPGAFWVDGDSDRLIQSVGNVLGNAEKFTPPEGAWSSPCTARPPRQSCAFATPAPGCRRRRWRTCSRRSRRARRRSSAAAAA